MGPYANVDPRGMTIEQLKERQAWIHAEQQRQIQLYGYVKENASELAAGSKQVYEYIQSYPERKAAQDAKMQESQRSSLVAKLQGLSKTGGSAYQTVMGQVNKGNARIGALAASGRGGLNAGINASNAQALSSSSGRIQGEAAREATKAGARQALGQVIAQGQDANNAAIQQQIADLQAAYGQAPSQNPYMTAAAQVGGLAQAAYQAYGNQPSQNPNDKNKAKVP